MRRREDLGGLTEGEYKFVKAFVADPRRRRAAAYRMAYPNSTPKSAAGNVVTLLKRPQVQAAIAAEEERYRLALDNKDEVTKRRLVEGLLNMGELDLGEVVDEEGRVRNVNEMPRHVRKALQGFEMTETTRGKRRTVRTKVKLADRNASLMNVATLMGLVRGNDPADRLPPVQIVLAQAIGQELPAGARVVYEEGPFARIVREVEVPLLEDGDRGEAEE